MDIIKNMKNDITFCTFFFDIKRGEWDHFNMHNNTYLFWFKNILRLNVNLYIETEEKFAEVIANERKLFDPNLTKTLIKVRDVKDLKAYKQYNSKLENLMFSEEFKKKVHHKDVPEMSKPLYNVLMFNKLETLQNGIEANPFNTEFFSWVDVGFIRAAEWVENVTEWPNFQRLDLKQDKIRFFCIDDNILPNLKDKEYHCMSQIRFLKGTIFFLHKSCLSWLTQAFDANVDYCLNNNFIGSDEKIFDLCYIQAPEKFDLVKCDWRKEFHLYL